MSPPTSSGRITVVHTARRSHKSAAIHGQSVWRERSVDATVAIVTGEGRDELLLRRPPAAIALVELAPEDSSCETDRPLPPICVGSVSK